MQMSKVKFVALVATGVSTLVGYGGSDSRSPTSSFQTSEPTATMQPTPVAEATPTPAAPMDTTIPMFTPAKIFVDNVAIECDDSAAAETNRVFSFDNEDDISSDSVEPDAAAGRWSRNRYTTGQSELTDDSILEFAPDQGNPSGSMVTTIPFAENNQLQEPTLFYAGDLYNDVGDHNENVQDFSRCSISAEVLLDEVGVCDYTAQLVPFSVPGFHSAAAQPVELVQGAWQPVQWTSTAALSNSEFEVTTIGQLVLRLRSRNCREFVPPPEPTPAPRRTESNAKFEPEAGNILVFIGNDNEALGGSDDLSLSDSQGVQWNEGYLDYFTSTLGAPAGISHRIDMIEGKTRFVGGEPMGTRYAEGVNDGLNGIGQESTGMRCLRCYLESSSHMLDASSFYITINLYDGDEDLINGLSDDLIEELGDFLIEFSDYPFFLQIGEAFYFDFDSPENYQLVFQTIVDALRNRGITNFATVMGEVFTTIDEDEWSEFYPGSEYVDWVSIEIEHEDAASRTYSAIEFARKNNKPVFISGTYPDLIGEDDILLGDVDGEEIWNDWFTPVFNFFEENSDVVKAVTYLNGNINARRGRGPDARIQANEEVANRWIEKMRELPYIHNAQDAYEAMGFNPEAEEDAVSN